MAMALYGHDRGPTPPACGRTLPACEPATGDAHTPSRARGWTVHDRTAQGEATTEPHTALGLSLRCCTPRPSVSRYRARTKTVLRSANTSAGAQTCGLTSGHCVPQSASPRPRGRREGASGKTGPMTRAAGGAVERCCGVSTANSSSVQPLSSRRTPAADARDAQRLLRRVQSTTLGSARLGRPALELTQQPRRSPPHLPPQRTLRCGGTP